MFTFGRATGRMHARKVVEMAFLDKALYKKALRQLNSLGPHAQDFKGEVRENPSQDSEYFVESSHALWLHVSPNLAMTLAHARPRDRPAQDPSFRIGILVLREEGWDNKEFDVLLLPFSIHKHWDQGVGIFVDAAVVIMACTHDEPSVDELAELEATIELVDGVKVCLNKDGTLDIRQTVRLNVRARAEALGFPDFMWALI